MTLPSIVGIVKASRNATLLRNDQILKDGLCEATTEVEKLLPKYADIIVDRVAKQCILNLEPAHTIPRLFRRTNRDAPNKPSSYVSNITKPLLGVSSDFPVGHRREWTGRIVCSVSERYFSITSELLTSVKRTEDSLLKLKSYRKSLVPTSSGGLSDDNKIRLQLALDIEQYASQVATVQLEALELPIIRQLLEIGQSAKTASSTSPN